MYSESYENVTRRRVLGLLGTGTVVGLAGGSSGTTNVDGNEQGAQPSATPDAVDQPTTTTDQQRETVTEQSADTTTTSESPLPDSEGSDTAGTSLAGTCGAAFGDTDTRYDPGGNWVVTFAYPMGGEVINETRYNVNVGYPAGEDGLHDHSITINQRGPYDGDSDIGATRFANEPQFTDKTTATYQGSERTVAVIRNDFSVIWTMGIQGPDGVYELQAQGSVRMGDPCPEAYDLVCERVMNSFQPK